LRDSYITLIYFPFIQSRRDHECTCMKTGQVASTIILQLITWLWLFSNLLPGCDYFATYYSVAIILQLKTRFATNPR